MFLFFGPGHFPFGSNVSLMVSRFFFHNFVIHSRIFQIFFFFAIASVLLLCSFPFAQ